MKRGNKCRRITVGLETANKFESRDDIHIVNVGILAFELPPSATLSATVFKCGSASYYIVKMKTKVFNI